MRAILLDMPDEWSPGAASEYDVLRCVGERDPIVLVATATGQRRARAIGLDPVATICPVRSMPWITTQQLDRVVRRLGITELSCRSVAAQQLASGLHVISISIPVSETQIAERNETERSRLRRALGLRHNDRLLVPLACHASQIDSMVLCMGAITLSIAELPTVTLLPAGGHNRHRARAYLSGADRVLDVIATDLPTMYYAQAADAVIWGPHHDIRIADAHTRCAIRWARGLNVPVLCPSVYLDIEDEGPGGELFSCNGTGGADIASAMLSAFGSAAV
ncbi:MAG: hypothetical protein KDA31_09425 [Phycisphaerales bacterium]|nr:hypothetical protein [Phycisphaerales bacterium]MCB9836468.1 hypothetical protein [Phycisphaera sp.]